MKNKKVIIILTSMILLIGGVLFVNQIYNKSKNKHIPKRNNLAIMVKGESGEYVSSDAIPKGNYVLNEDKTICENNGKVVNYDSTLGTISFSFVGSDSCSLYFDKIIDTEKPVIDNLIINDTMVTVTLTDNMELSCYGISTSNSIEPTSWTSISGTSYNLSTTITTEGIYYLWVKDSSGNKTTKEFMISLGTSFETLMVANNTDIFDENGLRYEGADPNNYICLDSNKEGACSNSLLFRIIGLFDEEYSLDGTTSAGTKKLLKIRKSSTQSNEIGKYWSGSQSNKSNNWSKSNLYSYLNSTYLNDLNSEINSKIKIIIAKWHLGGANSSNLKTLYVDSLYQVERNTNAVYSGNPTSVFAKVGLVYPSDYGYATNVEKCRSVPVFSFNSTTDCYNQNWIFNLSSSSRDYEWMLTPSSSTGIDATRLYYNGNIEYYGVNAYNYLSFKLFPALYLDSSILKIVGGTGTSTNPYHIG